nr:hypothetical protein [Tanacetum cinerariifolium]
VCNVRRWWVKLVVVVEAVLGSDGGEKVVLGSDGSGEAW